MAQKQKTHSKASAKSTHARRSARLATGWRVLKVVKLHILFVFLVLFLGVNLLEALRQPTASSLPSAPAGKTWQSVFSEEFNGTSLNTAVWTAYYNTYGDGNNELACLTPNNVAVNGGSLKITAKRENITCPNKPMDNFSSGFISTKETNTYFPRYGFYEMRAKLPHAQGLWPAFWLRHKSGAAVAEVDIVEYFHSQVPGKSTVTLHLDGRYNLSKKTTLFETPTDTPAWHTWGVQIEPSGTDDVKFSFYLDGALVHAYTDTQANWNNTADNNLFDIAINLAVGGKWVGHPDDALGYLRDLNTCAQGGTPPNGCVSTGIRRETLPMVYEVDYVRVSQLIDIAPVAPPAPAVSTTQSTPAPATPEASVSTDKTTSTGTANNADPQASADMEDTSDNPADASDQNSTSGVEKVMATLLPIETLKNKSPLVAVGIVGLGTLSIGTAGLLAWRFVFRR